jgi:hypothetical protein
MRLGRGFHLASPASPWCVMVSGCRPLRFPAVYPSGKLDKETQASQAAILPCFQLAALQAGQPQSINYFKHAILVLRKRMQQGSNEHVSRNTPDRV